MYLGDKKAERQEEVFLLFIYEGENVLRERKIVLFVMGDEEILERSRMVVSQLALEYSVKIARNYSAAY